MADKLGWGLLAAGNIAKSFARGVARSRTGKLVAVASRSKDKADKFAQEFEVPRAYGSYEELLADPDVQAVYVSTPHPMHAEWAIKAAEAGKHILCEKPMGLNHAEAMAMVEAAAVNDVFLMEAFMYRCHPQTEKLVELLGRKVIGEVRVIKASFSFQCGYNPDGRLLNNALGGGGILDVGCYPVSMARLVAGVALGGRIAEPLEVKGVGRLGATGVDEWAAACMLFPGDIVAQVATGVQVQQDNVVQIFGADGNILIPSPWVVSKEGGASKIVVSRKGQPVEEVLVETDQWLYGLEADTVARNLSRRQAAFPAMSWQDSLGNLRAMDMWRESIGLTYNSEKPQAVQTVDRRPLAVAKDAPMKYGRIAGLDKPISRLVMGVDNQKAMPYAAVMFDDFFRKGGNCFDTAYIYGGGGACEKVLGQWIANRGIRQQVVILDKGAHSPCCNPADLTRQLLESLQRLQTDHVDIYMMHRDNPSVPVGEFIDVLNEHVRAGRIRIFGGSNWSIERIEAANEYARSKGLQGFSAVSNNFSLARMVEPVWGGCIGSSDPAWRAWLARTRMPLMPWSSQARGFFTDRADPNDRSDASLARSWYSDDNFQRRARAYELAAKRGVQPVTVALAYVLCQPFPTFPLIGPRLLAETRTSVQAMNVELTPKELAWLNLENY